jgi:hypothetical protein
MQIQTIPSNYMPKAAKWVRKSLQEQPTPHGQQQPTSAVQALEQTHITCATQHGCMTVTAALHTMDDNGFSKQLTTDVKVDPGHVWGLCGCMPTQPAWHAPTLLLVPSQAAT